MKKALIGLAAGAAFSIAATAAHADGYGYGSVKDSMVIQQVNWNGLYIGAAIGYGVASTTLKYEYEDHYWQDYDSYRYDGISGNGFQGVLTLGYDRQIHPGFVLGVFGDYALGDLKSEFDFQAIWDDEPYRDRSHLKLKDSWAVGARLGLLHSCCTMWYVTAGYAAGKLNWGDRDYWYFDGERGNTKLNGWFVGGGIEQQLTGDLFLKFDYRYTDYGSETLYSYLYSSDDQNESGTVSADTSVHSIRLGVNWKVDLFGGRHAVPAYDALK